MILFGKWKKEGSGKTQNFLSSIKEGIYPFCELIYVFQEINVDINLDLSASQCFYASLWLCI